MFHQIAEYDVRLDELRVARDGKVHAFFTVKNRSGRDRDVHQGLLTMVLTDADGVGVRTSTPWRITGEEPTAFEGRPTIPNGGEFKLRFVLEPTRVHGPMRTLTVREGDTGKSLTFDASSTATRSELSSPPPAGGGAFKALSKFDVRIDRIAPARDGKLEAFLTLRNATRDVQSTTPSTIRLVGTDQDGAKRSSRSAHFSTRGERGVNDDLPILVYAEPGAEMRIRYVFDQAVTGAITITDDVVEQTFTPGQ